MVLNKGQFTLWPRPRTMTMKMTMKIVRALKTHPKAILWETDIEIFVVMGLQV